MPDELISGKDRIVEAVRQLNSGWNNTNYSKRPPEPFAKGNLYTVAFMGEDGFWRENYVFERGKILKPYGSIRDVLRDSATGIVPRTTDPDFIKLIVVSGLTFVFAFAVVGIVVFNPDNKSLQVLTGLLGLTLGYFVGKGDTPA